MPERSANPFVAAELPSLDSSVPDVRDEAMGGDVLLAGPATPDLVEVPADAVPRETWPVHRVSPVEGPVVVGLHGGAGTTTLASLLGPGATDMGQGWPVAVNPFTGSQHTLNVVAVARDDAGGLDAAERFALTWASGALEASELRALVLVASSPRLSDARKRRVRKLLRMVPHGTHVPWMSAWIEGPVDTERLPLRIKRIAAALNKMSSPTPKENPK